jgi:hypothetical protein
VEAMTIEYEPIGIVHSPFTDAEGIDVRESRVEVLAIVAKSSAAVWLAERGEEQ